MSCENTASPITGISDNSGIFILENPLIFLLNKEMPKNAVNPSARKFNTNADANIFALQSIDRNACKRAINIPASAAEKQKK